ncbi:hypothetical protein TNCV_3399051 [Trichonephila clavipes]|nr:hypothetical protein TNCV_3399051 [Trichonephila clavipes]
MVMNPRKCGTLVMTPENCGTFGNDLQKMWNLGNDPQKIVEPLRSGLEVNEDDIEELIMGHEDELTTELKEL